MKRILLAACFVTGYFNLNAQATGIDSNFHVYLLIGQSNMAGRAPLPATSEVADARILMLDSLNNWVPAKDPVHFDKPQAAGIGPAISFAGDMLAGADKKIRIGLIPCALGGSPIKVWQPGAVYLNKFHPYEDAIGRAQLAMTKGVLKGIIWHQGESDNDSAHAAIYLAKLIEMIQRFRTNLHAANLPFVAGEIGYFNRTQFINPVVTQLPGRVAHTAVVSAAGLTDKGDKLHFDAASARELGKRYAAAMKNLAGNL